MFKKEEVYKNTLQYYHGNDMAANIWIDKYCLKDKDGNYLELSPIDMYKRLATEFARIEQKYPNPISYEEIYKLLENNSILPGGSILYGLGNNYSISSLGNCFVIGNEADSYGGICNTDQEQVQLMKRRGGVGHDLSHLRPALSLVTNSAGSSTGPVSFMPRYSNSTREVAQDGRRGALMLSMNINHPDAEKFITSKDDLTKITGANISVKVSDDFLIRYEEEQKGYPKNINPYASNLWNRLIHQAWKSAEPGVLFWDKIISESPADCYEGFKSTSTNPCGEIPLCPYDSCRLLSVNLYNYVDNPFTSKASFNYERFDHDVKIAQKLMDDIVDLEEEKVNLILNKIESDPEPEEIKSVERNLWIKIKEKLLQGRRTGLSGIGLADTLAALNYKYVDGIDVAESIYKALAISAYKSSIDMANDRGCFPIWDAFKEENNSFLERIYTELDRESKELSDYVYAGISIGRRNIALLTIPPSGTISLLAGISSGIEPVYMLSHVRRRKVNPNHPNVSFVDKNGDSWEEYEVLHSKLKTWFESNIYDITLEQMLQEPDLWGDTMKDSPYKNSTAYELNPIDRVKMQATIQKWVDHSISSTINLPKETTEEQVSDIYRKAWEMGCKGLTIYRDGCREGILISNDDKKTESFHQHNSPKRPDTLLSDIFKITVRGREWIVAIGLYDGKPFEVFAFENKWEFFNKKRYVGKLIKAKKGRYNLLITEVGLIIENITDEMTQGEEDRTRLISTALRHGANIQFVVEQLNKSKNVDITSFSKAIARVLKTYIKDGATSTEACPLCGGKLIYRGGCTECSECGEYSKCG